MNIDKILKKILEIDDLVSKKHTHSNKNILDVITQALIDNWSAAYTHISDSVKHITSTERTNWNDADSKKHIHSNKSILDTISQTSLNSWDDKYTKNEVDNKINQVVSNMDWKESVATYANIATTYPTPDDGWTVNVKDTDITYRYDGSTWIPISANSIPLASSSVDGKMSKQDKIDHDDMNSKKHTHSNKSIIDIITQALIDTWNSAYSHISDSVKHITSGERTLWNTVSNKLDSTANAVSASKWATARTISLTGDVLGTASVDGSANANITTVVANDSHNHTSSTITDFLAAVRATILTGLSTATNSIISATDTVLVALGKLQAQITANLTTLNNHTGNTNNPHSTTASQIGLGNLTNDAQVKRSEMGVANGVATLDSSGVNTQAPKSHTHDDRYYTESESDAKYATKAEISSAGYGNMLKSIYDTNGDGVVDNADKIDNIDSIDLIRATNSLVSGDWNNYRRPGMWYVNTSDWSGHSNYPVGAYSWGTLTVFRGYQGDSNGFMQVYMSHGGSQVWVRGGYNASFDSWKRLAWASDIPASLPANGGNADTVDGFHASQTAGSANTAVIRDGNGYIQNTWFNSNRGSENSNAAQYLYDTGDGYMRKKDLSNVRAELVTAPFGLGGIAIDISSQDCNNIVNTGFYRGNNCTNRCPGSHTWTYLMVIGHDTGAWISQIGINYNNDGTYIRAKINGTWSAWRRLDATATSQITNDSGFITASASINGNAATASKWATARMLNATGDVTGAVGIDGSRDSSISLTLANSGVAAGTYKSVTVDSKGRVTGGTNPTTLAGFGITDAAPAGYGLGTLGIRLATSTDLNKVKANGWYDINNPVNAPYSGTWVKVLVVASADVGYVTQMAFGMAGNYVGRTFTRTLDAGTWGSWSEVYSTVSKPTANDVGAMKKGPLTWNDIKGV